MLKGGSRGKKYFWRIFLAKTHTPINEQFLKWVKAKQSGSIGLYKILLQKIPIATGPKMVECFYPLCNSSKVDVKLP